RVDADGSIAFPLLNRVMVGGLTTAAIEAKLKAELIKRDLMRKPQINVDVAEFRSKRVWIIGAVRAPNEYKLIGDMSLIAALAQAGGLTEGASNDIRIMRPKNGDPVSGAMSPEKPQDAQVT